jgi:parvulin-like peptidyl-prolyl isomerase
MKKYLIILISLFLFCVKQEIPKDGAICVNGTWIKKTNIDKIVEIYKQEMVKFSPTQVLEGFSPTLKKNVAKQLIASELMLQEAKKRGITCDSNIAIKMIDDIKKRYPDAKTYENELAKSGQTHNDLIKQAYEGLLVDSLIKTLIKNIDTISLEECKTYYNNNSNKFTTEKRYRASQIMFIVKNDYSEEKKKLIEQKAQKVLSEIKSGMKFESAVKKYSEDPASSSSQGDIGWFKKGDLKKEFDTVISTLKIGEISNVFKTDIGLHILKKTGEENLPPPTFENVKDQIKTTLLLKKQNDIVTHFVDSLMSLAKITYADTSYKWNE